MDSGRRTSQTLHQLIRDRAPTAHLALSEGSTTSRRRVIARRGKDVHPLTMVNSWHTRNNRWWPIENPNVCSPRTHLGAQLLQSGAALYLQYSFARINWHEEDAEARGGSRGGDRLNSDWDLVLSLPGRRRCRSLRAQARAGHDGLMEGAEGGSHPSSPTTRSLQKEKAERGAVSWGRSPRHGVGTIWLWFEAARVSLPAFAAVSPNRESGPWKSAGPTPW